MTSDIDIYRAANVLVKRYGEDATLEAAQRADVMLERGDMDGCARRYSGTSRLRRARSTRISRRGASEPIQAANT